ncbi:hypothetical protein NDU88_006031 [Pleurodeles waltl]|uniref:Uncharacterized protein n=1 Tax=Pleurodeles waltl TaxID=8319 RepID=A0AAV7N142_PLEWA|nr:hypothetical protein NDU88_006031 [Pleurodeles waltl]
MLKSSLLLYACDEVGPGVCEESDIRGGAVKEIPDFSGVFMKGADVEDVFQGLWCRCVVVGGLCQVQGLGGGEGLAAVEAAERSMGVGWRQELAVAVVFCVECVECSWHVEVEFRRSRGPAAGRRRVADKRRQTCLWHTYGTPLCAATQQPPLSREKGRRGQLGGGSGKQCKKEGGVAGQQRQGEGSEKEKNAKKRENKSESEKRRQKIFKKAKKMKRHKAAA